MLSNHRVVSHLFRTAAVVAGLMLPACGDSPDSTTAATGVPTEGSNVPTEGSGSGSGSEAAATCWLDGVPVEKCPVQPRGNLPADCPSGRVFEGADFAPGTGPCAPSMPDWDCPEGWRSVPGFTDGSGNEEVPEGMTQFSICEPPESSGWVGAPEGSGTVGAPELPPTPTDCPAGTIAVPGDAACRLMGSPCPSAAERWASEADLRARAPGYDGPVVYVAADAATDGAGTRTSPRPLGSAVATAAPGSLLALALGTYDAAIAPNGIAVVGACVSGSVIAPTAENPDLGAIELDGGLAVFLSNFSVTGNHQGVVLRSSTSGVAPQHSLRDVTIRRVLNRGLYVTARARVLAQSIRLEGVRPSPVDGSRGRGGQVDDGAALVLRDAYVVDSFQAGLMAFNPDSVLDAESVLVAQNARQGSTEGVGRGIEVLSGSATSLTNVALLGNHDVGLLASDAGTTVVATGLLIEDTQPNASDQTWGRGIGVQDGAALTVTGATLRNNHDVGLLVFGEGTRIEATGLLVEGTQPQSNDQTAGWGIGVQDGAMLTLRGATLRNNRDVGLLALGSGTRVEATGLLVEGTQPQSIDQTGGQGIAIEGQAAAQMSKVVVRRNHEVGVVVEGAGTSLVFNELMVSDTQPRRSDMLAGIGLLVRDGAASAGESILLLRNHETGGIFEGSGTTVSIRSLVCSDTQTVESRFATGAGIDTFAGASVDIQDALILRNRAAAVTSFFAPTQLRLARTLIESTGPGADGADGMGVAAGFGASVSLEATVIRGSYDAGIYAIEPGTSIRADGLTIRGTQSQSNDGNFGDGVILWNGPAFEATNLLLWDNARCGLQVAGEGVSVAVQGALIGRNQIGTNLQSSDFTRDDLAVGLRGEIYWENGLDIGAETLPLPDLLEVIESLDLSQP